LQRVTRRREPTIHENKLYASEILSLLVQGLASACLPVGVGALKALDKITWRFANHLAGVLGMKGRKWEGGEMGMRENALLLGRVAEAVDALHTATRDVANLRRVGREQVSQKGGRPLSFA